MTTLITVIHIIVCLFMVGLVLLQHGKGADMGATFGGGSSQTVFGSEGPVSLLNKITTGAAIVFMVTSVVLAYYSAHSTTGTLMRAVEPAPVAQKAAPAPKSDVPVTVPTEKSDATFPAADAKPAAK